LDTKLDGRYLKLGKDIVWIEAPFSETKVVQVPNATKPKLNMGFGVNDIRPAANVDFLNANPDVEKFLQKASIPLADIASQNLKMNDGEKSEKAIKKHALEWIKDNQSTFDSWIK
jgi:glycine betaine/proline transport system substrate-binding protein